MMVVYKKRTGLVVAVVVIAVVLSALVGFILLGGSRILSGTSAQYCFSSCSNLQSGGIFGYTLNTVSSNGGYLVISTGSYISGASIITCSANSISNPQCVGVSSYVPYSSSCGSTCSTVILTTNGAISLPSYSGTGTFLLVTYNSGVGPSVSYELALQ